MSVTRILQEIKLTSEKYIHENSQCNMDESPVYTTHGLLTKEFGFFGISQHIIDKFNTAMKNDVIKNSLDNAQSHKKPETSYNWIQNTKDIYTENVNAKIFVTREGKQAALLEWKEKNNNESTFLVLSDNEVIFLPPIAPKGDIDQLRYDYGMRELYSNYKYRNLLTWQFVRKIANTPEVVKLIGESSTLHLKDFSRIINIDLKSNRVAVTETIPACATENTHVFLQEYGLNLSVIGMRLGFYPQSITYKQNKGIITEILETMFGENHCARMRKK